MVAETLRGHPRPGSNSLGALGFYPTEGRDFVSYDESSPAVKVESGGTSGILLAWPRSMRQHHEQGEPHSR